MPTELVCPSCDKKLRAHDGLAGAQALCPFCRKVVNVPAAQPKPEPAAVAAAEEEEPLMPPPLEPDPEPELELARAEPEQPVAVEAAAPAPIVEPAPAAPTAEQWWAQTTDGQQFGPVPKAELDSWVADGSITAECQVLRDGDTQWQWASDVYPQLAQG